MPKTKKKQKAKSEFKPTVIAEQYPLDEAQAVSPEPKPRVPTEAAQLEVNGKSYVALVAK